MIRIQHVCRNIVLRFLLEFCLAQLFQQYVKVFIAYIQV